MNKVFAYVLWPALAGLVFALALILAPVALSRFPALYALLSLQGPGNAEVAPAAPAGISFSSAIKKAAPAVVSINSKNTVERTVLRRVSPFSPYLQADTVPDDVSSLGSGVIVNAAGYVVTSYHVFFGEDANRTIHQDITVTLSDQRELEGTLVALDETNDLAVLKIDGENLPSLSQVDDRALEVGDVVLAIGNPRNIGQSVSFGIISALWRRDDSFVIQTDAAINPGNSGGALIDIDGNLVGINSTIVSESGGSEGISFAIPASQALALLDEYLATSTSGYLGVDTNALSPQRGLEAFGTAVQGFIINEVTPNSPADKAGLRPGDVMTGVDGEMIRIVDDKDRAETNKALAMIRNSPAGKLMVLEIFRGGETVQIPVILGVGRPSFSGVERIADSLETGPADAGTQETTSSNSPRSGSNAGDTNPNLR
jgi:serine protease DegQ